LLAQEAPPPPPMPPAPPAAAFNFNWARGGSYLGTSVQEVTAERAKELKLPDVHGVEVTRVEEDSPAAKAGIKEKDVVLEFAGQAVQGMEHLKRLVAETPVGRQVKIVVWRNGAAQTLTAAIGSQKNAMPMGPAAARMWTMPDIPMFKGMTIPPMDIPEFSMDWQNPRLGIIGEPLGKQEQFAEFFGVKDGVLVKSVVKNSPAEKAGIKAGDVIVKVDDSRIATAEDITKALRSAPNAKTTCVVTVVRGRKETPITVTLEARTGGPVRTAVRSEDC